MLSCAFNVLIHTPNSRGHHTNPLFSRNATIDLIIFLEYHLDGDINVQQL